jgi:hypothetical protein
LKDDHNTHPLADFSFSVCHLYKKKDFHHLILPTNEDCRNLMATKPFAMKQTLLLVAVTAFVSLANAQKKVTAYAITGAQKGQSNWAEVRLIDIVSGEEVKPIYQSAKEVEVLNARTGKPVVKKAIADNTQVFTRRQPEIVQRVGRLRELDRSKELNKAQELLPQQADVAQKRNIETVIVTSVNTNVNTNINTANNVNVTSNGNIDRNVNRVVVARTIERTIQTDKPFATSSAALAYDQKHERLYYTPMSIAQLRYIDLKTGKIYFFEDEAFGVVKGRGDVQNQITRMVIASDGNGYAITNDANHLIRFTTGKKPETTDLGALTDDASNGSYSVHNGSHFGGDVIADANKNLYLIGADRTVYKINLEAKVASYLGSITGLPKGFTTNGAVVEGGSKVIVTSSTQTIGYYRFDLNTLQAEKVSTSSAVYNASDLANGTLAFEKEKKKGKNPEVRDVVAENILASSGEAEKAKRLRPDMLTGTMSVYPNPVTNGGTVKVSFANQLPGRYQIQLIDAAGQIVSTRNVTINSKTQTEEFQMPQLLAYGNYMVKVVNSSSKPAGISKIVVQ